MAALRRLLQRFTRSAPTGPLPGIIMYHRIADVPYDPWGLAVSPRNFAEQLRLLKQHRTVLTMTEFIALFERNALPNNAVSITFDDGYRDNLTAAAPLLKAEGLSATLFLSTGPSQREQPYWYDELAAMLLDRVAPIDLSVELSDGAFRILLPEQEEADGDRSGWRAWQPPRTAREALYYVGWKRIKALRPAEQQRSMGRLREVLPVTSMDARPLSRAEIRELLDNGAFSLGGHTADHPDLTLLTSAEAYDQILRCKLEIDRLGSLPGGFAYPYGSYNEKITTLVRHAGYRWACTTDAGSISRTGTDIYRLPRIAALDEEDINFLD